MKTFFGIFLALAALVSLPACLQAAQNSPASASHTTQAQAGSTPTLAGKPASKPSPSPATTATNQPVLTATLEAVPTSTPEPTTTPVPGIEPGGSITLTALAMSDETTGWGVESTGHIVRTTDGGSTWQDVTPPQGQYKAGGFFARDASAAWATPYQGECVIEACASYPNSTIIWRTTDGGRTWQPSRTLCLGGECGYDYAVPPGYINPIAMQFVDEKTGWILMTVMHVMFQDRWRVYRTADGGETWTMVNDSMRRPMVFLATGLAFLDQQTGWFGTSQVNGATDPVADWSINRTQNGGATWEQVELPPPDPLPSDFSDFTVWCGVVDVSSIPPKVVDVTFSCDVLKDNSQPRYYFHYHSLDGGQSWHSWQSNGHENFVHAELGWRLYSPDPAQANQLQKTTAGGSNWINVRQVDWQSAQFDFINEQVGWAIVSIGDRTALVHTRDGGLTWTELKPKASSSR